MGKFPHLELPWPETKAREIETKMAMNSESSLAEMLCALSFVADIGMGQRIEHGLRSAYVGLEICRETGAGPEDAEAVFYGALLKDAGCTACATVFASFFGGDDLAAREDCLLLSPDSMTDAVGWFWRHSPADLTLPTRMAKLFSFLAECKGVMKEGVTAHCEVGRMFSRRLAMPESVSNTVLYSWERWDGKGMAYGIKAADIPLPARILHVAQVVESAFSFGTATAADAIARQRRATDFDPDVSDAIIKLGATPGFWTPLGEESVHDLVMDMRPASSFDALTAAQSDSVCELLADFADAKCQRTWNHSTAVADSAKEIAMAMGLGAVESTELWRAGLVHDIGKAAVPVGILEKGDFLTQTESERFRAHPEYTERVLSRIGPLERLTAVAAAHHEQLDGHGYHRGAGSAELGLPARILATADKYTLMRAGGQEEARVLDDLQRMAGSVLDGDCIEGLRKALGGGPKDEGRRPAAPSSLSEREVEVLRLVTEGATARDVAEKLVISRKTVERHLENIYNKLGVTSKTAAAVYAVTNRLV